MKIENLSEKLSDNAAKQITIAIILIPLLLFSMFECFVIKDTMYNGNVIYAKICFLRNYVIFQKIRFVYDGETSTQIIFGQTKLQTGDKIQVKIHKKYNVTVIEKYYYEQMIMQISLTVLCAAFVVFKPIKNVLKK